MVNEKTVFFLNIGTEHSMHQLVSILAGYLVTN